MRSRVLVVLAMVAALVAALPSTASAQTPSCADYDTWEWAQLVFDRAPTPLPALDPDGNGIACEELPRGGFPPAVWTDAIPADAQAAELVRVVDGDTLEVLIDGVSNRVRIYRADTPENQTEQQCGGDEAAAYTQWALGFNDAGTTLYLERDVNTRDQYGRELAYVWFMVDGQPYMLNYALIATGWAADVDYGDRKYDSYFNRAEAFAEEYQLGVYALCGAFGVPLQAAPTPTPVPAPQVPVDPGPAQQPAAPEQPAPGGGCDPNYTPCVPLVDYDLDCADIGFSVTVIGVDVHGFDGNDNDGYGCESY